jgi:signal transduction histidine kinase
LDRTARFELMGTILDSLEANIAVLDQAGWILAVNGPWRAFARLEGPPFREAGEKVNYLEVVRRAAEAGEPVAREAFQGLSQVLAGSSSEWSSEYACERSGATRWFALKFRRLASAEGRTVVIHEDISDWKRSEAALVKREKHAQALLHLARRLELAEFYGEALQAAREVVQDALGYTNLWAYLLSEDGTAFKALAAAGSTSETVMSEEGTATLPIHGDPMLEEIATAREIVVVEDARTDPRTNKAIVEALGNLTLVNVPILLMGRILGSIGTGTFGAEGVRVPDALEREFLMSLASQVGASLDRIRLLRERRQLEQQLARTQKMESLGSLAGGMAHDMNNVLGAIMALASVHRRQAEPASSLQHGMDTIIKACERGGALVKGLLGFARQDLSQVRLLDLNTVVVEEVALLKHTTLQRVRLEMDLDDHLRPILGDPSALSHALMNLCVNAVDAMPEGGTLLLRTRNGPGGTVELAISDSGCGMSQEIQEKALDPFFTTKPEGKGTGLGLPIVYGTMKAHHGKMTIQSATGAGTTVLLSFPAGEGETAPAAGRAAGTGTNTGLDILVIDDDELVQASLGQLLEALGHRPTMAERGEEGLRLLEKGLPADAVILDWNMPGLGGAGTLPRLRELRPELPVLLSTGRADKAAQEATLRISGVTLLLKPFTLEQMEKRLEGIPPSSI